MCALALFAAPSCAQAQTVVSLTFDDGAANQLQAKPLLLAHRMRGTFYIISGTVGSNSYYMTWPQIADLAAAGNEIGGHTRTHPHLTQLKSAQAQQEVCGNRADLQAHGFDPVSFAYPYGDYNAKVETIVENCGYVSARRVGGLTHPGCGTCLPAESIPPGDPYALRSNASDTGSMTLAELQGYVIQAENAGGGWVPLTFHDICAPCPPTSEDSSITPSDFGAFLDWLAARAPNGTVVKSVRGAMGLAEPPLPPLAPPPPPPPLPIPPPDKVTAFAALKARSKQHVGKLYVSASMPEPGTLSATGTVNVPGASKVYRFRTVSRNALPGAVVKLRLTLTKKGLRAVMRALSHHRRLNARLTITARDRAGNARVEKRKVKLIR